MKLCHFLENDDASDVVNKALFFVVGGKSLPFYISNFLWDMDFLHQEAASPFLRVEQKPMHLVPAREYHHDA